MLPYKKEITDQRNSESRELFTDMDTSSSLSDAVMNIEDAEDPDDDEEPIDNSQE